MNAVRFDHVSKAFGTLKVLDDISFEIPMGQAFCLLGRSGTGKSVALRHIVALVRPDSGKVFVEERDMTTLAGHELAGVRKRMGFLFQNAALFDSMSVGENVAFPMRAHTTVRCGHARARVRTRDVVSKGFDSAGAFGGMSSARACALDGRAPHSIVDERVPPRSRFTASGSDELLVRRKWRSTLVWSHTTFQALVSSATVRVLQYGVCSGARSRHSIQQTAPAFSAPRRRSAHCAAGGSLGCLCSGRPPVGSRRPFS